MQIRWFHWLIHSEISCCLVCGRIENHQKAASVFSSLIVCKFDIQNKSSHFVCNAMCLQNAIRAVEVFQHILGLKEYGGEPCSKSSPLILLLPALPLDTEAIFFLLLFCPALYSRHVGECVRVCVSISGLHSKTLWVTYIRVTHYTPYIQSPEGITNPLSQRRVLRVCLI